MKICGEGNVKGHPNMKTIFLECDCGRGYAPLLHGTDSFTCSECGAKVSRATLNREMRRRKQEDDIKRAKAIEDERSGKLKYGLYPEAFRTTTFRADNR